MFSKQEYYYQAEIVGNTYSNSPGIFQLNRVLSQQPGICLQNNASQSVMQKRHIIINDWGNEVEYKNECLFQHIGLLLDEGFNIYQIQGEVLVPVKGIYELKPVSSNIIEERTLYKLLHTHKLEKDKVYHLSHEKIMALGEEKTYESIHIETSQPEDKKKMLLAFKERQFVLTRECPPPKNPETVRELDSFELWDDTILNYCIPANLTKLTLRYFPWHCDETLRKFFLEIPNVNSLNLNLEDTYILPFDLLSNLPKLESLTLQYSSIKMQGASVTLPNLKSLTLKNARIEATDLEHMLLRMSNLESLSLHGIMITGEFQHLNSSRLKSLSINNCKKISASVLSTLVNESSSLISLKIDNSISKNDSENIHFNPAKTLRILSIQNNFINAEKIAPLLSESLVFLNLTSLIGAIPTIIKSLNHLTHFVTDSDLIPQINTQTDKTIDKISDLKPMRFTSFKNLQGLKIAKLQVTTVRAIQILTLVHATSVEAELLLELKYTDFNILYRQNHATKQNPESILIINKFDEEFIIQILDACPWIRTVQVDNPSNPTNESPTKQISDTSSNIKFIFNNKVWIHTEKFPLWKTMGIQLSEDEESRGNSKKLMLKSGFGLGQIEKNKNVFIVTGGLSATDLVLLLQKMPENSQIRIVDLDIFGDITAFPILKLRELKLSTMSLEAQQIEMLANCIQVDFLEVRNLKLLSPISAKASWRVLKLCADGDSWNNGLFALLKTDHLELRGEINDIALKSNKQISTLDYEEGKFPSDPVNQNTLTHFNNAFPNLRHLILKTVSCDHFKKSVPNRFMIEQLNIKSTGYRTHNKIVEFMEQFPKLKELVLLSFSHELLIDFKKYCPDLKKIEINYISVLNINDLNYLVKGVPSGCKIILQKVHFESQFTLTKWCAWLCQHPQVELNENSDLTFNPKIESSLYEDNLPGPDFKPHESTSLQLDPQWSQSMLINRLIAWQEYLLPAEEAKTFGLLIKKGICSAVAKLFADTVEKNGIESWNAKWKLFKSWDKKAIPPKNSQLKLALDELLTYVSNYQLAGLRYTWNRMWCSDIVTNDLAHFLDSPPAKPLLISNSWHRTCLIFRQDQWYFFDPNYKLGQPLCFLRKEEVVDEIYRVLGNGLEITSYHDSLNPCWNTSTENINKFLETGGFGLIYNKEQLKKLTGVSLGLPALEGLFFKTTNEIPFWYYGLILEQSLFFSADNTIQQQTLVYLKDYTDKAGLEDFKNKIYSGIAWLNSEKRQLLKESLSSCKLYPECTAVILSAIKKVSLPITNEKIVWLPERDELTVDPLDETQKQINKPDIKEATVRPEEDKPLVYASPNDPSPALINHPFILTTALAKYQKNPIALSETNHFKKWVGEKNEEFDSITEFEFSILKNISQNILLHIPDNSKILNYLHHLQASKSISERGLFVINTFDDLHCAIATISMDINCKGSVKSPFSGLLYDFLTTHKNAAPIIAVNWSNFTPRELIQANTIIDKLRHVDNVLLPKNAIILSLQNPLDPNAYSGSDFSSRHRVIMDFPEQLSIPEVSLPQLDEEISAHEPVVDLFNDSNWETHFYGHWKLTEQGFFFEKSDLLSALEQQPKALKLIIKNAPFHIPKFKFAFNSLLSTGSCRVNDIDFKLPQSLGIKLEEGYDFKDLFTHVISMERGYLNSEDDCVLNPGCLASFFENYQINPHNKTLITLPGLIEKYKSSTLSLCLTAPVSLAAIARVLSEAKKHSTRIKFKIAPGVSIPEELSEYLTENEPSPVLEPCSTRLIITNDIHCTEKMVQQEQSIDMCVDISEETKDNLLYAFSGTAEGETLKFNETISAVWEALLNKKTVMLKGHFSPDLVDALASLFKEKGGIYHNGKWEVPLGKLILLTDNAHSFPFVFNKEIREESFKNKIILLGPEKQARLLNKYPAEVLADLPYSFLNALALAKVLPENPGDLLKPLYQLPKMAPTDEDYGLEYAKSKAFKDLRKSALLEVLDSQPTLFLSGETGVGKSSFMHELEQDPNISVVFGDIESWLNAPQNKLNILFMDEANLIKTDWLLFEGLYSNPPSIFYKGKHYPLDENQKVVFGGNPAQYGGQRGLPELFKNHPNVVTFGAMNNAYLYHEVLKPVLQGHDHKKDIARIFLKSFQEVKKLAKEAISARELQMMAYLFQAEQLPKDNRERAKIAAWKMAYQVLPPEHRLSFQSWFDKEMGALKPELEPVPESIGRKSTKHHALEKEKNAINAITPPRLSVA